MSEKRMFDPNKARQRGVDGDVENVDLRDRGVQGMIYRGLQDLEMLKGATTEDYDAVFGYNDQAVLQKYKNLVDQMAMNLKRIMDSKGK